MRKMQGKAAMAIGAVYVGFVGWSLYGAIFPWKPILPDGPHGLHFRTGFPGLPGPAEGRPLDDGGWT